MGTKKNARVFFLSLEPEFPPLTKILGSAHARHINPCLVLVQPRKPSPGIEKNCLLGHKDSKQTKNSVIGKIEQDLRVNSKVGVYFY